MSRLESLKRLVRRWFWSILFFVVIGLILGFLIAIPVIPKPHIATINISGLIHEQAHVDSILGMLRYARNNDSIKAVVLHINSPGGSAGAIEQIYLDLLLLRQEKPVVASIGTMGASGGYYVAIASNFIYAEPTSFLGSVGVWSSLPSPEQLDENIITSGPLKATGGSRRKYTSVLETFKRQFIEAVTSQRGDRLKISEEELSRAEIYTGRESLKYGLIDDIGTVTAAIEKAGRLAGIRHYGVVALYVPEPVTMFLFSSSDFDALKSQPSPVPLYYYLYFEQE